jgi:hypothetical protein
LKPQARRPHAHTLTLASSSRSGGGLLRRWRRQGSLCRRSARQLDRYALLLALQCCPVVRGRGQAVTRAPFDLCKFLQSRWRHAEAVEEARIQLRKEREAVGLVCAFLACIGTHLPARLSSAHLQRHLSHKACYPLLMCTVHSLIFICIGCCLLKKEE